MPEGIVKSHKKVFSYFKKCVLCSIDYIPTGSRQKYCIACKPESIRIKEYKNYHRNSKEFALKRKKLRDANKLKALYNFVKYRCKKENIKFDLEFRDLAQPERCPVLKTDFVIGTEYAMSIDRINPNLGYVKGNVQVLSRKANTMKSNASKEELLKFADWIYSIYG